MSDQPVRFNPVGNMDKDSDPRYVRQGNYIDAKNIQKLTEKGGTGGAVIPTKGNEFAFDLGCFEPQNKKYRIKKGESDRFTVDRFNTVPKETDQEFPELSSYLTHLTLTLSSTPTFVVGDFITISGATPTELNGAFEVTSISGNDIVLNIPQNTIPAIAPTSGNSIIIGNPTIDSGVYEISFQTMNQNYIIQTVVTAGDIPSILSNLQSSPYGNQFTFTSTSQYIDVELNTFDYYDYYIESVGNDRLEIFSTQEAIPVNIAGCLVANGSFDLLGDLFITSTTLESEPERLNLNVVQIQNNPNTTITFSTNHDFVVGEWIGITESEENWLNGTFLIDSIPNPNQIVIITSQSWNNSNILPSVFNEVIVRNPQSIGEIGVALYDYDADTWSYTRLLRSIKLNFLTTKANDITGRDDIRRRTLYYTDDYNNRRAFYYYGEYMQDGALNHVNPNNYYTYDNIDQQSEVSSPSIEAKVNLAEQLQGGALKAGNKRYFCYLVDYFGNRSAYSQISNIVSAYEGVPSGTIYGNDVGHNTYKKNKIRIEDIDQEKYEYIALGYIDYTGEVVSAYALSEREITGRVMIIEHNGTEEAFTIDLATITVSNLNIPKKALNVDLIDNRLVFSNLIEPAKIDLRDWSKTFKHRIKRKLISESTKYQLGEYQDVHVIHDNLGYMLNETYRFGVQVYFTESGTWSEASWIDDIKIDFKQINESNPENDNRREQNGNDIVEDYDLNESIISDETFDVFGPDGDGVDSTYSNVQTKRKVYGRLKVPYVEFFGFDLNFEVEGTPIRNIISKIKIVRAECIPEVIATGPIVMSVGLAGLTKIKDAVRNNNYLTLNESAFYASSTNIGVDTVAKTELDNPLFPLSYGYYDGDLYYPIAPKVCLTENDADPKFNWVNFEGTFHEYPFAFGTPAQAGIRPYKVQPNSNNVQTATMHDLGFWANDQYWDSYNLNGASPNPYVSNAFRRVFYSDSVGVGNAGNGFYWDLTNSGQIQGVHAGYPDFVERYGETGLSQPFYATVGMNWICPVFHYGEDPYELTINAGGKHFEGKHGQPFGLKIRIANEDASARINDAYEINKHYFYPFWANRRIVTFYSPDILLDNEAIPTSGKLNVFGEYRMDRRHHNDIACGIFTSVANFSGYSEYTVEGMGTTYSQYDINDIFDVGDGGVAEIYDGATFRKGYSAQAKEWEGTTAIGAIKDRPYEKYNNLWINPRSLVLKVDGNSDASLRDGLTGIEAPNKNTDYGVYYVQMFSENKGKYGSTGDSSYIDTGFSIDVIDLTDISGIVERNQINVFGGDTFTQSTYLAARKINPTLAPDDGNWNASTEGRIDAKGPGWGGGMKFYSQNRVNSQLRTDDADSFLYPKDTQNQGDWLEDFVFGHGGNFRYNSGYTPRSGVLSYNSINDRLLKQQVDLPSRIDYSEKYEQNTLDDKNQSFLPLNFKDIDQAFGEILSHKNVNGELFTLQPRKFQAQFFNASGTLQTESTEGLNVVIGDGAVLARDGRTLSSYGTEHKWSVIKGKSPGGKDVLYWYNQESKLIMRFGADGTVTLSDVHGLRSFLENDARWTQGKDTPYAGDGVRVVWDDEYKEAIWTWRGVRKVAKYIGGRSIVAGAIVENTNAPSDTFDNIPRLFRCTVAHNSTPNYEPGVGADWHQVWEQIEYDNEEYYTWFTLAFNEMTNGFSSFYSHHPKIYFPWRNKFLSAHPTEENKIYEHRRGEYTTWYKTEAGELSEDAYIEGVVNYMPESSKKFVATQVISDEEPYRMEFETKRHKSHLVEGDFDDHDDHWRSPIKNDTTGGNAPDADTESLTGDYIKVKFFIEKKVYNRLYNFVIKVRERLRVYRK
jgi:hypothetical protein